MTINSARGSHSSPGIYMREQDVTYSTKSLGITSLGLAGETLKGPAFEPVSIEKWSEFVDYFGNTSTEQVRGSKYPKFELPYIAKEYLKESKKLSVVRVLGLSGYDAGKAWVIKVKKGSTEYAIATLRSKGSYNAAEEKGCKKAGSGDTRIDSVTGISIEPYTSYTYNGDCEEISKSGEVKSYSVTVNNGVLEGYFTLVINGEKYPVSLNYGDRDYIGSVLGSTPFEGKAPAFIEEFYDYALIDMIKGLASGETVTVVSGNITPIENLKNYATNFKCAQTPWFVSEIQNEGDIKLAKKLFRVYTISDGNAANKQVKISIQNIRPDSGCFDLVVRDYYDTDSNPIYLEKFTKCDLIPGSNNYLPLKVGTIDNAYELKSKYIALEMSEEEISGMVPCGFMGFPLHDFGTLVGNLPVSYNTEYNPNVKAKRQYFGMSNVDEDLLRFKGNPEATGMTEISNGFHLDTTIYKGFGGEGKISIDGKPYVFDCVNPSNYIDDSKTPRILSEEYMKGTLYEDVNVRKFTVYPYGGFDGWDIYREERTITDNFHASKYGGATYNSNNIPAYLNLPTGAINSDYYAFLGAYRQFANPEAIDINLFATPGIDLINNQLLVEDALDMIEDNDEGRRGDALYVVTSPNKASGYDDSEDNMYDPREIVESIEIDSSYAATYWPWVKVYDTNENKYLLLPPTKDVVRNMAYTDNNAYPWFSPAGMQRGDVDCVRASKKLKLQDEDTLYDGRVNPIKTFAVDGVKVWGNKTLYSIDSPLNRVNVRRLMIRVKKLVNNVAKNLLFEQMDSSLKTQFLSLVNPILSDVKKNRGISDYRIDVDDSAEARDAHTLPATIHIKPTPTLEWIDLTFTIYPESVDFQ